MFCSTISNPYLLNFIQQFGEIVSGTTDDEDFNSIITSMSSNALESAGLGSMLGRSLNEELEKHPVSSESVPEKNTTESPVQSEVVQDDMSVEELLILGETKSRQRDIKGALAIFNKIISIDPASDMAWFNRGVLLEGQRDARGAKQAFRICLDLNPDHAPATANMAVLLERMGEFEDAANMAKKALHFYPGHPTIKSVLERTSTGSGESDDEVQDDSNDHSYQKATLVKAMKESGVDDEQAVLEEARHHDLNEDSHLDYDELKNASEMVAARDQAVEIAQEVKQESFEDIPEVEAITEIAHNEIENPKVEDVEIIEDEEVDIDSIISEAKMHLAQGNPKDGLRLLKPHLQESASQNHTAWLVAGLCMAKIELYPNAIQAVRYAIQLEQSATAWHNLAKIYVACSDNNEATNSWKQAISVDSSHAKSISSLIEHSKSISDAENYFFAMDALLEIDPNSNLKSEYIDELLAVAEGESVILENIDTNTITIPEGPKLAQKAANLIDDKQSKTMAKALSLMNDHPSAISIWKAFIQNDKENPDNWTGLAKALEYAGDLDTASKCHAKANALSASTANLPGIATQEGQALPVEQPVSAKMEEASIRPAPVTNQVVPEVQSVPIPTTNSTSQDDLTSSNSQDAANSILLTPVSREPEIQTAQTNAEVDLAKAALDATNKVNNDLLEARAARNESPERQAMQAREWFNRGTQLLEDKKYRQALNCFDKALTYFGADEDKMVLCLNARGNVFYYLEDYKKCVESYLQAMRLRPTEVKGQTLYNMGTAYAAMERYPDAIKCFEQAIPRGLSKAEEDRCKTQIKRCKAIQKAANKKQNAR